MRESSSGLEAIEDSRWKGNFEKIRFEVFTKSGRELSVCFRALTSVW